MKLNGEYILREVVGEYVLVPVGETALQFNGIISLNEVGAEIWKGIEAGEEKEALLQRILEQFEVSEDVAKADLDEFLQMLLEQNLVG